MKKHIKKIAAGIAVVVLLVAGIFMNRKEEPKEIENPIPVVSELTTRIIVEIKGEVKIPGLYEISSDSRVYDIIQLAGGFTESADTANINLAEKLKDGMVVLVKKRAKVEYSQKISINTAGIEQLTLLSGIGEVKARAIIEYRTKYGKFNTLEELLDAGISKTVFEQIKGYICL